MSDNFDLEKCLSSLKTKRPVFHSEADFQFALAWEIKELYPDIEIRLEYPINELNMYIDIMLLNQDKAIPIELK